MLYRKLALISLKKNMKIYVPYILTYSFFIFMLNVNLLLLNSENLKKFHGIMQLDVILELPIYILTLFSLIFLYYSNKFIFNNRSNELSLYGILGLNKKSLLKIMFWEDIIIFLASIIIGLLFSSILYKLISSILFKLINLNITFNLDLSLKSYKITIIIFFVINIIIFTTKIIQIKRLNLINLLRTKKQSEIKESRLLIKSVLTLLTLLTGYTIALTIKNPLQALSFFFVAVVLVIIGTFGLFETLSIVILRKLKKNKNLYYKTKNFTAISGLIFRIKQNSRGLASICIMSCATLVLLSFSYTLHIGIEKNLENIFPRQFSLKIQDINNKNTKEGVKNVNEFLKKENIKKENILEIKSSFLKGNLKNSTLEVEKFDNYNLYNEKIILVEVRENKNLKENTLSTKEKLNIKNIKYKEQTINYKLADSSNKNIELSSLGPTVLLEVTNIDNLFKNNERILSMEYFDLKEKDANKLINELKVNSEKYKGVEARELKVQFLKEFYGGVFFVGIFLSLIFIAGSLLIIYYKQLQEGYEDVERFKTLRRVGITQEEIKNTINTQVKIFFMLPILISGIHLLVAYPMLSKILIIGGFIDEITKIKSFLTVFIVFLIIYYIYYKATSKVYYKVITNNELN